MSSGSKRSSTPDLSVTNEDTKTSNASDACSICHWLTKLQDGTQKEILRHLSKYHPPVA